MQNTVEQYRALCASEFLPLYAQPWWLDAVCGPDSWGVCIVTDAQGLVQGALPYTHRPWRFVPMLRMPMLTAYLHLYLRSSSLENPGKIAHREVAILRDLLLQLPKSIYFDQQYDTQFTSSMPFTWAGFRQTTRYTYHLDLNQNLETLQLQQHPRVRNYLNRDEPALRLEADGDLAVLYELMLKSARPPGLDLNFLRQLDAVLQQRNCARLYIARDASEQAHAAVYFAWDSRAAYFLLSGYDPKHRKSQAMRRLLWQAIQDAADLGCKVFDFQGSMDEGVAHFFQGFGAARQPYHRIYRSGNRWIAALLALRNA